MKSEKWRGLTITRGKAPDWIDYLGILVFIHGCVFNTSGEIQRNIWKRKPENTAKIYTQGFFKYSMHINYFGDLLWVTGYAIITQNWYSILIPAFLFGFFAFYNIPMLDKYLHDKYDGNFEEYAKKTKRLIPFVY